MQPVTTQAEEGSKTGAEGFISGKRRARSDQRVDLGSPRGNFKDEQAVTCGKAPTENLPV